MEGWEGGDGNVIFVLCSISSILPNVVSFKFVVYLYADFVDFLQSNLQI